MAKDGCRTCGKRTPTGGMSYVHDIGTSFGFEVLDAAGNRVDRYRSAIAAATASRGVPGSKVNVLNPPEPVS